MFASNRIHSRSASRDWRAGRHPLPPVFAPDTPLGWTRPIWWDRSPPKTTPRTAISWASGSNPGNRYYCPRWSRDDVDEAWDPAVHSDGHRSQSTSGRVFDGPFERISSIAVCWPSAPPPVGAVTHFVLPAGPVPGGVVDAAPWCRGGATGLRKLLFIRRSPRPTGRGTLRSNPWYRELASGFGRALER